MRQNKSTWIVAIKIFSINLRIPSQPFLGPPLISIFSHWPFWTEQHLLYSQAVFTLLNTTETTIIIEVHARIQVLSYQLVTNAAGQNIWSRQGYIDKSDSISVKSWNIHTRKYRLKPKLTISSLNSGSSFPSQAVMNLSEDSKEGISPPITPLHLVKEGLPVVNYWP